MAQYNNLNLRKIKIALVKKMSLKKKIEYLMLNEILLVFPCLYFP